MREQGQRHDERESNRWGNDPLERWISAVGIGLIALSIGIMIWVRM